MYSPEMHVERSLDHIANAKRSLTENSASRLIAMAQVEAILALASAVRELSRSLQKD
jgi:hypothetical protein